jgi:hypothetical protein
MTELAKSDLFFVITSISVISLTVIVAILLIYVFFIVKKVKNIVDKIKEGSDKAGIAIGVIKSMFSGKKSVSKKNKKN